MKLSDQLPTFLPGKFSLARGYFKDYLALAAFHYVAPKPATIADIRVIRYRAHAGAAARPVAVGVLSYPVPSCHARERVLGRVGLSRKENVAFVNRHIRTISRVIVHPQFRALGLSTILVRALCRHCRTRYVEAIAAMGRVHPFFERAGMKRIEPEDQRKPVYFILDRSAPSRPFRAGLDAPIQTRP